MVFIDTCAHWDHLNGAALFNHVCKIVYYMIKVHKDARERYSYSVRYNVGMPDIYLKVLPVEHINCDPGSRNEQLLLRPSLLQTPGVVVLGGDYARATSQHQDVQLLCVREANIRQACLKEGTGIRRTS